MVIVQKPIVPPTFSGTYSESPNQFLMRLQEYAAAVDGWDQTTLLLGISQFLRDAALDWHYRLNASPQRPRIWSDFVSLFLSRFDAPLKIARQARQWHQCKQMDDETIDDFYIRLRLLWTEQRSGVGESDFIQQLLCNIRTDLFRMMTVLPNASTKDILLEAQQVEEALYGRNEQRHKAEKLKNFPCAKKEDFFTHEVRDENFVRGYTSTHLLNSKHASSGEGSSSQSNSFDDDLWDSQPTTSNDHSKNRHRVSGAQGADARSSYNL